MTNQARLGANADEQDVASLAIRIVFQHPWINPTDITNALNLVPSVQSRVNDRIVTPTGEIVGGTYPDTRWSLRREYKGTVDLNACTNEFLEMLRPKARFIKRLSLESYSASIIVSLPGQLYFGDQISAVLLREIAEFGLALGLEVFPDSAT